MRREKLEAELLSAGADRIFYLADAFRMGMSLKDAFDLSKIDPWFLSQVEDLVLSEKIIEDSDLAKLSAESIYKLKQKGFSDKRLSELLHCTEEAFRGKRLSLDIKPVF